MVASNIGAMDNAQRTDDKTAFVISTHHLSGNDRWIIRSLTLLLWRKLEGQWVVTEDQPVGDVTICYPGQLKGEAAEGLSKTRVVLLYDFDQKADAISARLQKPIRSNNFVSLLNSIVQQSRDEIQEQRQERKNEIEAQRKASSFSAAMSGMKSLGRNLAKKVGRAEPLEKNIEDYSDRRSPIVPPAAEVAPAVKSTAHLQRLKENKADLQNINVVLVGSSGVGKSTLINTVSTIPTVSSDVSAVDSLTYRKKTTTVGIDYGEYIIADQRQRVRMIGNPGQHRFNKIWSATCPRADALFMLVDLSRVNPLEDLFYYWSFVERHYRGQLLVVGKTHRDVAGEDCLGEAELREIFPQDARILSFTVDPRNIVSVESSIFKIADALKKPE